MSLTPFYIPDSSPILSYSGPGGWHSAYTPRGDGYDQTFHQVSGPGNEISFNLTSAGFTLSHATVAPECPLEYSVNGSDFRSTCEEKGGLKDLKYGLHRVVLRTGNVTVFQLFGIVGSYTKQPDQDFGNTTQDDTSPSFTYTPRDSWKFLGDDGSLTEISDNVNTTDQTVTRDQDQRAKNRSVAVTSESGSKVDIAFKGSAVYVYGQTGPDCGQAEVMLDSQTVAYLNMTNTWRTDRMLLYTAGGLDRDKSHHLELKSMSSGKMVIDYAVITDIKSKKGGGSLAPLIAGVVGGIVVIILLGVVVHLYLMARIRYKIRPTPSVRSDVESWRKQTPIESAEACSPCEAYHDEGGMTAPIRPIKLDPTPTPKPKSFTLTPSPSTRSLRSSHRERQNSGKWPIAKLYTRQHRRSFLHLGSEGGSTDLSSNQDYIAYKDPRAMLIPPVPALPPATGSTQRTLVPSASLRSGGKPLSPVSPPAIVGLDSSAERWLQENTYIGNPPRPSSGNSHRSPLSRGHSLVSRGDHDDPHTGDLEAYEIVGVTHMASHARRSIARLWSTPGATPSLYGTSSLYRSNTLTHAHGPEAVVNNSWLRRSNTLDSFVRSPEASQTVPVSASASATVGLGTFDSFSSSFIRPPPPPLTLLTTPSSAQPSAYTPSSRNRPQTPLRRGVSIKSAKTVRSFFSNWIKGPEIHITTGNGNGNGSRPDTPARPQTAARPDSGIFPLTLGLGTVDVPFSQMEDRDRLGGGGANMFIELDPSSPLTASRPASEWQGKRSTHSKA